MTRNYHYWQLVQGKSKYIMAAHNDECRKHWIQVFKDAKVISDAIEKIRKIRQPQNVKKAVTLNVHEKKVIQKYLKSFRKCEKQEYEILDEVGKKFEL
jgi:hypothetical protein